METTIVSGCSECPVFDLCCHPSGLPFGGESNLSSLGLTYAEYARQGFQQLLVVAGLVVGAHVVGAAVSHGAVSRGDECAAIHSGGADVWRVGVVLMRLSLYEQAFGFTRDRLNAHYFLVVIAAVLVLFLIGLSHRVKQNTVLRGVVIVFAVGLLGLNLLNPDAYIACRNVERGEAGYVCGSQVPRFTLGGCGACDREVCG